MRRIIALGPDGEVDDEILDHGWSCFHLPIASRISTIP
jgi:hypothetical protein